MLGYTVISITEVSMYILIIIIQTENTLLMGSPKDLYWGLCCSLFTLMTSPEPQIYCFQYYLPDQMCGCARRARLCVWDGLTNILFIDESMAV